MKLTLIYPNGTRYSYKGFTKSELVRILRQQRKLIKDWFCTGFEQLEPEEW